MTSMMRSIYIAIPDDAADKLAELARREYRRPREQAAFLLIDALRHLDIEVEVRPDERRALTRTTTDVDR